MAKVTDTKIRASYGYQGDTIEVTNDTAATIPGGAVLQIGNLAAVASSDILPGAKGPAFVRGAFNMAKKASQAIDIGKAVCLKDGKIQLHEDGDFPVGYAAASAAADDAEVLVLLAP